MYQSKTDHCNFCCFLKWKILAHSIDLEEENQALQSLNFQARSQLVTQKITGQTLKNQLSVFGANYLSISRDG